MKEAYRRSGLVVLAAALVVLAAGGLIVRSFYVHVTVPCRGFVEEVPVPIRSSLPSTATAHQFEVVKDWATTGNTPAMRATNTRLHWTRPDGVLACNELPLPVDHFAADDIVPDGTLPDTYVIIDWGAARENQRIEAFRTVDRPGRKLVHGLGLAHFADIPAITLVVALLALLVASARLLGARGYALRYHAWKQANSRFDGMVESEGSELLARLPPRTRREQRLLVNPDALGKREAYRDLPQLERRDIAWGGHDQWRRGTARALRDSRVLATVAAIATLLGVVANQLAG